MRVTYMEHSGFVVELVDIVLIFDYYKGSLSEFSKEKEIYVFASHSHYDHFKKKIFEWAEEYPNIRYILSSDIKEYGSKEQVTIIEPNEERKIGRCNVKTLKSTDEGVAFLIGAEGKTIYHAGDLNWWDWEEESPVYREMMKRNYQYEISKIRNEKIDVAFVPVDGRLGGQYYLGLDWFMKETNTRYVFPMHFWGAYEISNQIANDEHTALYRERIVQITKAGEVFELND